MKKITTLHVRNKEFVIVLFNGFYCAIDKQYINHDGRINKVLNGAELKANKDLTECITTVKNCVEIEYLMSTGHSKAEAFAKVFNLPLTDQLKAIMEG